jgi:hypothetical protein
MTSSARALALVLALPPLALAGCGNYSNEDLEFENAFPDGDQIQPAIPPAKIAVADEADLAQLTHNVTTGLNGLLSAIVNLVDAIRSQPPTSRGDNSRTWGPAPANNQFGWLARMMIWRDSTDPSQLDYDIAFHKAGGADTDWPELLTGWFRAGQTVRRGRGHFEIDTATLRAEGFDPNLGLLDHMTVDYDTGGDPVVVQMDITNLPDPTNAAALLSAAYDYASALDGRRQMTFDFAANIVPGPMIETTRVISQWLDTGEGKATMTIVAGEALGAMEAQCWDRTFRADYTHKDWSPPDVGTPDVCPDIAVLSVPDLTAP